MGAGRENGRMRDFIAKTGPFSLLKLMGFPLRSINQLNGLDYDPNP